MMVDMMIKAANITNNLQQQKNNFRTDSNKDFNAVFKDIKNTSVNTKGPKKSAKKETPQKDRLNQDHKANTYEIKEPKEQATIEEEEKVTNDSEVEKELAALKELQQLLSKLEEENINPEDVLALLQEIAGLMESISPEILKGELLKLQETLKSAGMDLTIEEGTMKLDGMKEILPAIVKELEAKISDVEKSLASAEGVEKNSDIKFTQTLNQTTNNSNDGVMEEQSPEGNEEVLLEQMDLTPKGKDKDVTSIESAEAADEMVTVEEVSEFHLNRGDVALNPAKFTNKLEATLEQSLPEVDAKALVQEVVKKVQILVQKGKSEMKIQLTPENLGTLHITISLDKGTMTAKMFAENQHIKEMIDANLNQLKIALGDKGVNISKLEVAVGHNQEDFNRSQYYPQKQRNKQLKVKRVSQANLVGIEASTFLDEGVSSNPYVVNSKFNGLA